MNRRAALLAAAALMAAACGSPGTVEALFGEGSTRVTVGIDVPAGWHAKDVYGRIILAENESELNAGPATGARLSIAPAVVDPAGAALEMMPPGEDGTALMWIVTEPRSIEVAGFPAVEVAIEDWSGPIAFVRRYLVVHYAGTASLILIEVPAERWDRLGPMLDDLLQQTLHIGA